VSYVRITGVQWLLSPNELKWKLIFKNSIQL
jgi:hypothetical protein